MPKRIEHASGWVEELFTLDEVIAQLEELRRLHGGGVVVACAKDSSDTVHPLDASAVFAKAEDAWDADYDEVVRGDAIVLSIND